ncbi:MAG TPA: glycosyltransferase [Chitinophagaceae bacterium]|nr:glycosyltransferase [Chitinophagaceae bacterium]
MQANDMIHNRDIVIVGQQPWDVEIGSNCKNIAVEFSRHNRVLYVNSPLDRITKYRRKHEPAVQKRIKIAAGLQDGLEKIADNLWTYYPGKMIESINWIKSAGLFNLLNKRNNKIFADCIGQAMQRLGFKDIILFNDNDIFRCFYLKELLQPVVSIYYSRDYLLTVDYWKLHGAVLEPRLIAKSDLCVANSTYLADYCRQYNPASYYVGQGCELDIFSKNSYAIPADMQPIAKPVIGYVGALQALRLDIKLLEQIAEAKPAWQIVLVGPEDDAFKASALHRLPNVHFLGSKPPATLPEYINSFDVCLNPQVINQVTQGNYPRKIDEYLAMGKPVVATKTGFMQAVFSGHTYLCGTPGEYIAAIEKAMDENSPALQQARKAFAASHSWENNVKEIYKTINTVKGNAG